MPRGSRRSGGGGFGGGGFGGGGFGGFGSARAPAAPRSSGFGAAPRPAAAAAPASHPPAHMPAYGGGMPAYGGGMGFRTPGIGSMVGMGMGVGLGSAVGHGIGSMMFGRGSATETRQQIAEAQAAPRDQCGVELSMFNKCIEKKDAEECAQYYNDVMTCKRTAEGYSGNPYAATPPPQQPGMQQQQTGEQSAYPPGFG